MSAKGINLFTGLPQIFEISSNDIYEAIKDAAKTICQAAKNHLEKAAPDLISDIQKNGVYLTGGGALINGMSQLLGEKLNINVTLVSDPGHTAVKGAGLLLRNPSLLKNGDYKFRSIQELIIEE